MRGALSIALATFLTAPSALADRSEKVLSLEYVRGVTADMCPARGDFEKLVAERVGYDPWLDDSPWTMRVVFDVTDEVVDASYEARRPDLGVHTRTFAGKPGAACSEIVEEVAESIATYITVSRPLPSPSPSPSATPIPDTVVVGEVFVHGDVGVARWEGGTEGTDVGQTSTTNMVGFSSGVRLKLRDRPTTLTLALTSFAFDERDRKAGAGAEYDPTERTDVLGGVGYLTWHQEAGGSVSLGMFFADYQQTGCRQNPSNDPPVECYEREDWAVLPMLGVQSRDIDGFRASFGLLTGPARGSDLGHLTIERRIAKERAVRVSAIGRYNGLGVRVGVDWPIHNVVIAPSVAAGAIDEALLGVAGRNGWVGAGLTVRVRTMHDARH